MQQRAARTGAMARDEEVADGAGTHSALVPDRRRKVAGVLDPRAPGVVGRSAVVVELLMHADLGDRDGHLAPRAQVVSRQRRRRHRGALNARHCKGCDD